MSMVISDIFAREKNISSFFTKTAQNFCQKYTSKVLGINAVSFQLTERFNNHFLILFVGNTVPLIRVIKHLYVSLALFNKLGHDCGEEELAFFGIL